MCHESSMQEHYIFCHDVLADYLNTLDTLRTSLDWFNHFVVYNYEVKYFILEPVCYLHNYMQGYKHRNAYIATHSPLESTVQDRLLEDDMQPR